MAKIIKIINNIIDDVNFLLEKIAILLALLEYLFLIILKIIALKQAQNDSNIGAGADGAVIKETIDSATSIEDLQNILSNISTNNQLVGIGSPNLFQKIVEKISDIRGKQISYTTKVGQPGLNKSIGGPGSVAINRRTSQGSSGGSTGGFGGGSTGGSSGGGGGGY